MPWPRSPCSEKAQERGQVRSCSHTEGMDGSSCSSIGWEEESSRNNCDPKWPLLFRLGSRMLLGDWAERCPRARPGPFSTEWNRVRVQSGCCHVPAARLKPWWREQAQETQLYLVVLVKGKRSANEEMLWESPGPCDTSISPHGSHSSS